MIGAQFKKKASAEADLPAVIRITGVAGDSWTVTDAERFSETFALSGTELAASYRAPAEVPQHVDEEAIRRPTQDALHAVMTGYRSEAAPPQTMPGPDAPDSPEAHFARVAAERDAAVR